MVKEISLNLQEARRPGKVRWVKSMELVGVLQDIEANPARRKQRV